MAKVSVAFLLLAIGGCLAQKDPNVLSGRSGIVHLFEWPWDAVAEECERFLGPRGYAGVQVSPPAENVVVSGRPWWERYQPVSYQLNTRSGNEADFASMVRRCSFTGVRIYVDVLLNHMGAGTGPVVGTGGSTADPSHLDYPAVPYQHNDFHHECLVSDYTDASNVRDCWLYGLPDLKQSSENVREMMVAYLNKLVYYGVAGFRVDSAKHMTPADIEVIMSRVNNLNTSFGFPEGTRPFVYQEVIDISGLEAITKQEYINTGRVTEFKFGVDMASGFRGNCALNLLSNYGPEWSLLETGDALVFVDNHDNQRGHGGGVAPLTHKEPKRYQMASAFMLAWPYGYPRIMSSFAFNDPDVGPPSDANDNIVPPTINADGLCDGGWVCEHRWRGISGMVEFRNAVANAPVTNWWDNGNSQIAFCRGNLGFVVINGESSDLNTNLQTCLPTGTYCDVVSGEVVNGQCTGITVHVHGNGGADFDIPASASNGVIAIHVNAAVNV